MVKQGIAFCDHMEKLDDSKPDNNPGDLLSILKEVAQYYPVL